MGELTLKETVPTPDSVFLGHVLGFDKGRARPPSVWAERGPRLRARKWYLQRAWVTNRAMGLGKYGTERLFAEGV